jgi:hypothetical protein
LISWNVGVADSDFHPLQPAQRLIDAQALAPYFKNRPPRPKLRTAPVKIGQRLDRNERDHSERRDYARIRSSRLVRLSRKALSLTRWSPEIRRKWLSNLKRDSI